MSWVVFIPKEERVRVAAPALILVWHRLSRFFFRKVGCHTKRRAGAATCLLVWQRLGTLGTFLHTAAHMVQCWSKVTHIDFLLAPFREGKPSKVGLPGGSDFFMHRFASYLWPHLKCELHFDAHCTGIKLWHAWEKECLILTLLD